MKFAEHLSAHITPEWRKQYINYEPKSGGDSRKAIPRRKVQELKLAFSEFYLSLILLQNYQNLNYTGFRKILKKHDKLLNLTNGAQWRAEHVEASHFYTNKDIDRLISDTEATVTNDLEGGDRQKAMKKLRVPPLGEQQSPWTTFKVGLFSGSFIVLFITVVLSGGTDNFRIAFRLYRGPFLLVEFIFLIGINVYGWRSSGVNHVLIFELDPRNHLSEQHLMELAAIFGVVWALSILSFIYSASLSIPPFVNPLALVIIMLVKEAFPHLVNAGKYSTTFFVVMFATLRTLYNGKYLLASHHPNAYAKLIHITADFVLRFIWIVSFLLTENSYVSAETMVSILAPLEVFRAVRDISVAPLDSSDQADIIRMMDHADGVKEHLNNCGKFRAVRDISVAPLDSSDQADIIRMMEPADGVKEHLNNCGKFRAVRDISVAPLDSSDQADIIRMMDPADGVVNRAVRDISVAPLDSSDQADIMRMMDPADGVVNRAVRDISVAPLDSSDQADIIRMMDPADGVNEHLNNCGKFRAVRDISVAPLDSSDQADIIRMMDHADGVPLLKKESIQDLQMELELSSKML
ncbi:Xenotropic and polytropic murine leukemia virus receptor xpr1 [Operophtera brumata]|uniref:Xenotropic and polytropic murine leukemia virus receptor xpr1 n=1 Tax=Operophtera brumata TaxID=104452 RepID=A0A0L7L6F9_OPEBR|nr:Xenotropic and polytropic murine leukemia virus receptor xpr1 [Operophtera brumata]